MLVVLGCAVVGAPLRAQDDDPRAWLESMSRAFADLAYDGTFSYFGGNDLASLRVVHKVIDGQQRERLVHLNGAPREIVRYGDEVACIVMPGDALLELEASIPAGPFARAFVRGFERIDSYYALAFSGEDRIAGRAAARIDVTPVDGDRYGYRLWLDRENRMLLRSELIDQHNRRLEIFQFSRIVFGDAVDSALLERNENAQAMVSHMTLGAPAQALRSTDVPWQAAWLPAGFHMSAADLRRLPSQLKAVHTLVYTDGIAAFSVFVEAMPETGAGAMHSRVGATVSVNRRVLDPSGVEHLVTLVGELPDDTARRILANVRPAS
jgi:sigma-E factor negative regulatory protein RseB